MVLTCSGDKLVDELADEVVDNAQMTYRDYALLLLRCYSFLASKLVDNLEQCFDTYTLDTLDCDGRFEFYWIVSPSGMDTAL